MRAVAWCSALILAVLVAGLVGCRGSQRAGLPGPVHASSEPSPAAPPAQATQEAQANPPQESEPLGDKATEIGDDTLTNRFAEARSRPEKGSGPTQATEKAVLDGLRWLARHQNPDGSWGALSSKARCSPDTPCIDAKLETTDRFDAGLTGLALLCFLDAGFSHESKQDIVDTVKGERHRIGEIVKKGLEWLRKQQDADGSFGHEKFMYNQAIATMAMAKAFELRRNRYWREPAQKGIAFIEDAQRLSPTGYGVWGWRYEPRSEAGDQVHDSDTSVTTWCVIALESGRLAGLQVKPESTMGAMAFCKSVTADGGLVGYMDAKMAGATVTGPYAEQFAYHPSTMSALAMCLRIFATHNPDDPFLDIAAKRISQDRPVVSKDHQSIDYYYWHFGSLALNQLDGPDSPRKTGKYWKPWSMAMVDALLPLQDHTEHACSNGGWSLSDRWGNYSGGGPVYNTAMNVLTLETFYSYRNSLGLHAWVGTPAPKLHLVDDQGSLFSLSEYRGKVVLLDFWESGALDFDTYVRTRTDLVGRLEGRPFVLLTVPLTSDGVSVESGRPAGSGLPNSNSWRWSRPLPMEDPIREWFGFGNPHGAIVIDSHGTIRASGPEWPKTIDMVERLLEETEESARPK